MTDRRTPLRNEATRWWIRLFLQPALLLSAGALLLAGLGISQRLGWISAGAGTATAAAEKARYICPMMCTPAQTEPGRCPVCAMELVPANSGGGSSADSQSVQIEPAARRIANIQTVAVEAMPVTRTVRAIGELSYDEGALKSISAYVDCRLDRLYADFTGVAVEQGDQLALVYSPRLYSSQVELLLVRQARLQERSATLRRVAGSAHDLYGSARQRLLELGMTGLQIEQLEKSGEANSRMHLCAPISGTVIEKLAVEGEYVKEGQSIYRLADLSTVWLLLKLFPEDAALVRFGQKVSAEVQSLPGREFNGRVAFIDPRVDRATRTVSIRVVISNEDRRLRIGDYAKATIEVPVVDERGTAAIYDPDLADKWISPRHPHVVASEPGECRVCGVELVPASHFGFTNDKRAAGQALVVPLDAVLTAGDHSVVYVESEPGRFELRPVVLGSSWADQVVIVQGLTEGEHVATRGNFLIDSQMQLAGNPSLIDPLRRKPSIEFVPGEMDLPPIEAPRLFESPVASPETDAAADSRIADALDVLSPSDRRLAELQGNCPVAEMPLGSMGTPIKVDVNGRPVFICCEGCRSSLLEQPQRYLAKLPGDPVK